MLLKTLLIVAIATVVKAKTGSGVTFENIVVRGYSMYTSKFNVTIKSSNSLKEKLPKQIFDKIEIVNSQIPVLYKNSITDIEDLDELILDNDGISQIKPGTFKNVPQLRKLEIKNNKNLEEIRNGIFNNLNIATLDLSKNSINTIASNAFNDMPELLNINLADNQLKIWDKNWFANTPLLTRVSFQNNLIEEIPSGAFKNFQGEKKFGSLSLTINIILSNNKIQKIDKDAFKDLDKINNLWLDGNEIDSLDENLLTNVALRDLRIDNNKLNCLGGENGDTLKNIFVADTTHIDGNPWDCTCLDNIDKWAKKNGKDVIRYYSEMTCRAERIGTKINNLNQLLKKLKQDENQQDSTEKPS